MLLRQCDALDLMRVRKYIGSAVAHVQVLGSHVSGKQGNLDSSVCRLLDTCPSSTDSTKPPGGTIYDAITSRK